MDSQNSTNWRGDEASDAAWAQKEGRGQSPERPAFARMGPRICKACGVGMFCTEELCGPCESRAQDVEDYASDGDLDLEAHYREEV